jgi:hypothetical protein
MKKIFTVLISVVIFSCASDDKDSTENTPTAIGTWKLIEVLSDPGDGSGVYTAVNSDKTITFFANGKVEASVRLCGSGSDNESNTGRFDEEKGIIIPNGCSYSIHVEFKDTYMFLTLPCIEPCGEKYEKITNGDVQ